MRPNGRDDRSDVKDISLVLASMGKGVRPDVADSVLSFKVE